MIKEINQSTTLTLEYDCELEDLEYIIGKDVEFELRILHTLDGDADFSQTIKITHTEPGSTSDILIHTVLRDRAKLELTGIIEVKQSTPGTDASLLHKTLMLSDKCKVVTRPELLIAHDQVKCGHGATISKPDHKHLQYLRSRGLTDAQSIDQLTTAFINAIKK